MAIATLRTGILRAIRLLIRASDHMATEDEEIVKQDKRWNEKRLRVKLHDEIIMLHVPH